MWDVFLSGAHNHICLYPKDFSERRVRAGRTQDSPYSPEHIKHVEGILTGKLTGLAGPATQDNLSLRAEGTMGVALRAGGRPRERGPQGSPWGSGAES